MTLHTKQKGSIGELAIAKYLMTKGYSVFTELGDLSRTDLIALINGSCIKIQVKALMSKNGMVVLSSRKSGPNYSFSYEEKDIDIFAVYVLDKDMIFFISSKELLTNKTCMSFRIDLPKNNQQENIRFLSDYTCFEKALRDYTGDVLLD